MGYQRVLRMVEAKEPENLLVRAVFQYPTVPTTDTVDIILSSFILEARRRDGNCYPSNTLKNILAAIYRMMIANYGASKVVTRNCHMECMVVAQGSPYQP